MLLNKILKTHSIVLSIGQEINMFLVRMFEKRRKRVLYFSRWLSFEIH